MTRTDLEKQRKFAVDVTRKLREAGYEALWAGGCVRDWLLGLQPKDYDVATSAKPAEIREIFGRRRTLAIGAAFGVITVLGPRGAGQIEVATFRQDTTYSDGRHPDAVIFSSAEEDARRRDFTINGLFFDPVEEQVIDYVGGQEDLRQGIVRAIGDATVRLAEDKLRMLRAVRFAAGFGFEIEAETRKAVVEMADQLTVVSAERIAMEMRQMVVGELRSRAVELLRDLGLLSVILPQSVRLPPADHEDWRRITALLDALAEPDFPLALAALLSQLCGSRQALEICRRWKLSNVEKDRTVWLVKHQASLDAADSDHWPDIQRLLVAEGGGDLVNLLAARVAVGLAKQSSLEFCRQRLAWPADRLNPLPLITGDDLVRHGLPPGKRFKRLLAAARDAQLLGEIATREQALALVDRLLLENNG
jgi:tRNA nucleotidyltransferase/poly(A) polymerase